MAPLSAVTVVGGVVRNGAVLGTGFPKGVFQNARLTVGRFHEMTIPFSVACWEKESNVIRCTLGCRISLGPWN